jgi:hypothetical protein
LFAAVHASGSDPGCVKTPKPKNEGNGFLKSTRIDRAQKLSLPQMRSEERSVPSFFSPSTFHTAKTQKRPAKSNPKTRFTRSRRGCAPRAVLLTLLSTSRPSRDQKAWPMGRRLIGLVVRVPDHRDSHAVCLLTNVGSRRRPTRLSRRPKARACTKRRARPSVNWRASRSGPFPVGGSRVAADGGWHENMINAFSPCRGV